MNCWWYNRDKTKPHHIIPCAHCGIRFVKITGFHYDDVIMGTITSQITSLTIVYSTIYSDADQKKHQSSASLAFARGIHRGPVNSPHKWPVTRKMFPFHDVIMHTKVSFGTPWQMADMGLPFVTVMKSNPFLILRWKCNKMPFYVLSWMIDEWLTLGSKSNKLFFISITLDVRAGVQFGQAQSNWNSHWLKTKAALYHWSWLYFNWLDLTKLGCGTK